MTRLFSKTQDMNVERRTLNVQRRSGGDERGHRTRHGGHVRGANVLPFDVRWWTFDVRCSSGIDRSHSKRISPLLWISWRWPQKGTIASLALICIAANMLIALQSPGQVTGETPGYFPFVIPPLDASPSFTDMSALNPAPAGANGFVTIRDGHFVDGKGNRIRLLGSNLTFAGAFPPKDDAPKMAAHMRKLGMNVIRFHHIDTGSAPRGVWLKSFSGLDPEQMDKLDWLIFQLKQNGIYVNLNLHVSRTYPGIPKDTPRTFRYGKGLDNFYPEFIDLQKQYARLLLQHRNPYTKTTYAEEPAVIVVELNNENSLTNVRWRDLRTMLEPFHGELAKQWRIWLKKRYGTTAKLRASWNQGSEPLAEELLSNRDFAAGLDGWTLEQGNGAKMTAEPVKGVGPGGRTAVRIITTSPGREAWNLQFHQVGLDLDDGRAYTFSFRAKADETRKVSVGVRRDRAPWSMSGLNTSATFETEWQRFEFTFKCRDPDPDHTRVSVNLNNQIGTFWLADISLRRGGLIGLPEDQTLEAGNIALAPTNASDAGRADFYQFLTDTECAYVDEMMRFLRSDLGVKANVCCTQVSYGGTAGVYREGSRSDFMDMHGYWQHPRFPGKPWDGNNWHIGNTSMVADELGGTLGGRAWYRMKGKPFTVSEYDHPAPSDYAAELFPMIASFGAFQDWDGIYQFTYHSRGEKLDRSRIGSYFELSAHPGKLAFLPVAAIMFRQGAVAPGSDPIVAKVPTGALGKLLAGSGKSFNPAATLRQLALVSPVAFDLVEGEGEIDVPAREMPGLRRVSSTGEIVWDVTDADSAIYTVNAPAVRVAVGFLGGRTIELGDVSISVTKAESDWASVAVAALDGKAIAESARVLVVAVGRVENQNMGWNEERTSVSRKWGDGPTVAEGIGVRITLPGNRRMSVLSGTGTPLTTITTTTTKDGATTYEVGPGYRTLWYGVMP